MHVFPGFQPSPGDQFQIIKNLFILHHVLVPGKVGFLHLIGQLLGSQFFGWIFVVHLGDVVDQLFHDFTIVTETDVGLVVWNVFGLLCESLRYWRIVWIVDVKFEIRHDGNMVPEFVLEIVDVAQIGIHHTHDIDDGFYCKISLIAIFNGKYVLYHFVKGPSVFRKFHLGPLGVVIFEHREFQLCALVKAISILSGKVTHLAVHSMCVVLFF